jgi:hypothetical protein
VNCDDVRESAAVALLTRTPLEVAVTEHLDACPECRDELAGLAPLPGLLSMIDASDLQAAEIGEPARPALLERLLAAAARERRQRRVRVLAIAASLVLVFAVPLGIWGALQSRDNPPTTVGSGVVSPQIVWTAKNPVTGVAGRAQVWKAAWGSDLNVSVSGVPWGTRCTVVVVTEDGQTETAATWQASYSGTAQVRGTVAAPIGTIKRIDIVDDAGRVLLTI